MSRPPVSVSRPSPHGRYSYHEENNLLTRSKMMNFDRSLPLSAAHRSLGWALQSRVRTLEREGRIGKNKGSREKRAGENHIMGMRTKMMTSSLNRHSRLTQLVDLDSSGCFSTSPEKFESNRTLLYTCPRNIEQKNSVFKDHGLTSRSIAQVKNCRPAYVQILLVEFV